MKTPRIAKAKRGKSNRRRHRHSGKRQVNHVKHALDGKWVIVPRVAKKNESRMIADPDKIKLAPIITTDNEKALTYGGKQGAYKFLQRQPHLRKDFKPKRVA